MYSKERTTGLRETQEQIGIAHEVNSEVSSLCKPLDDVLETHRPVAEQHYRRMSIYRFADGTVLCNHHGCKHPSVWPEDPALWDDLAQPAHLGRRPLQIIARLQREAPSGYEAAVRIIEDAGVEREYDDGHFAWGCWCGEVYVVPVPMAEGDPHYRCKVVGKFEDDHNVWSVAEYHLVDRDGSEHLKELCVEAWEHATRPQPITRKVRLPQPA